MTEFPELTRQLAGRKVFWDIGSNQCEGEIIGVVYIDQHLCCLIKSAEKGMIELVYYGKLQLR